jgi:hypothetical protein
MARRKNRRSLLAQQAIPKWEERVYTPAVFVRVANKGLTAYGTWKNIRKIVGRRT